MASVTRTDLTHMCAVLSISVALASTSTKLQRDQKPEEEEVRLPGFQEVVDEPVVLPIFPLCLEALGSTSLVISFPCDYHGLPFGQT